MTTHRASGAKLYCPELRRVVTVVSHDNEDRVTVVDDRGTQWRRAAWQLEDFDDALIRAGLAVSAIAAATDDPELRRIHIEMSDRIVALRAVTA